MQLFKSRKGDRLVAQVKEQYGINLLSLEQDNKTFLQTYGKALDEYKASFVNYIASHVNYAQFQFQDYTLARIITELYLKDSVVSSCISTWQMYYPEPFKLFYEGDTEIEKGDVVDLVRHPNPWMTESDLDRYMITYQLWTGNAYLLKIYEDDGTLSQLFPFSGLNMFPVPSYDQFVEHFNFVTAEGIVSRIEPKNVIHLPWISIDPRRLFMGVSPLQLCSRDIQINITLTELLGNYTKNMPLPSLVGSLTKTNELENSIQSSDLTPQSAEDIKKNINERFTGDQIGNMLLAQPGWTWEILNIPLKDLELEKILRVHQCNICSNFKTDPEFIKVVAGMQSSTYDNQDTSKRNFFQGALSTMWVQNADKISKGLQPEYGEQLSVKYDIDSVRVLRDYNNQRLGTLIPALSQSIKDVESGAMQRESAIAMTCLTMGLDRREVEPLYPVPEKQPLSSVTVTPEGIEA